MKFIGSFILFALLLWCLGVADEPATSEKPHPLPIRPKGYVCYRASAPIVIDGRIDKPVWNDAAWTDDFVDIQGASKPKPRFRTRAKMLWDDRYFYIGAELEEPHVWATLTEHDSIIFQDNDFEVFIDPNGDNHEYYEFEMNALNTGWDLLLPRPYKDGGKAVSSWEIPGLKTAVHVNGTLNNPRDTDKGWTVEIAFPWKVLGELAYKPAPPRDGDQWRVNFSRVEWQTDIVDGQYRKVKGKPEDNWVWSPQGVIDMHRPETWGYVQFATGKPGSVTFQRDPAEDIRRLLHQAHYAQRDYRKKHGHWAATLKDIGMLGAPSVKNFPPLQMQVTQTGFEITGILRRADGTSQSWHIREDSRIWPEEPGTKKQ